MSAIETTKKKRKSKDLSVNVSFRVTKEQKEKLLSSARSYYDQGLVEKPDLGHILRHFADKIAMTPALQIMPRWTYGHPDLPKVKSTAEMLEPGLQSRIEMQNSRLDKSDLTATGKSEHVKKPSKTPASPEVKNAVATMNGSFLQGISLQKDINDKANNEPIHLPFDEKMRRLLSGEDSLSFTCQRADYCFNPVLRPFHDIINQLYVV
jgi:hypothetical protein